MFATRILILAPVINPLLGIICMTGKKRKEKRAGKRKMCNGRRLRCSRSLIHGAAEQYVVCNTIFAALHQWTTFQNIPECIYHRRSDYIMSIKQFLCPNVTIIIPQSAFEWCWRIVCKVVSLHVALWRIKDNSDIKL